MSPAVNSILSLNLIALGILGIILSFLVPDAKKSMIALVLGGLIILTGLFQFGSQSFMQFRMNQRMREIQKEQQASFEELRQKLKDNAEQTGPAAGAPAPTRPKK